MNALENCKSIKLFDRKDYIGEDENLRLVNYKQGNIVKDRKTLDKFLKEFYQSKDSKTITELNAAILDLKRAMAEQSLENKKLKSKNLKD